MPNINVTDQQEDFLYDVVFKNMEPWEAYKANYKNAGCSPAQMRQRAKKLMSNKSVQAKYQAMILDKQNSVLVDSEFVTYHLKDLALNAKTEGAKARALELLGKACNMFKETVVFEDSEHRKLADEVKKNRKRIINGEEPVNLNTLEFEPRSTEQGEGDQDGTD